MLPMFHEWADTRVTSGQLARGRRTLAIAKMWALTVLLWFSLGEAGYLLCRTHVDVDGILWIAAAAAFRLYRVRDDAEAERAEDEARRRRLALAAIDAGDLVTFDAPARRL